MFAAMRGHLDCLKYLHETAKAPWDWDTATSAAKTGHLHILQYLVERKYDEYDAQACEFAAENGHLDCLKYLHETAKAPWDDDAVRSGAREQPTRMFTIPPRQQLPITRRLGLAIRRLRSARLIIVTQKQQQDLYEHQN